MKICSGLYAEGQFEGFWKQKAWLIWVERGHKSYYNFPSCMFGFCEIMLQAVVGYLTVLFGICNNNPSFYSFCLVKQHVCNSRIMQNYSVLLFEKGEGGKHLQIQSQCSNFVSDWHNSHSSSYSYNMECAWIFPSQFFLPSVSLFKINMHIIPRDPFLRKI